MKYVNYAVKSKVESRVPVIILLFLISLVLAFLTFKVFPKGAEVKEQVSAQKTVISQAENLESTNISNNETVTKALKESGKDMNIELDENQIITDIGVMANKNKLSIDKLASDDPVSLSDGDLSSLTLNIELRGTIEEIEAFLKELDNSKYISKIESMSYRMDGQTYLWMYRAIDEETPISWFDISNYSSNDSSSDEDEDLTALNSETMLKHGIVTCYLQIDFVGKA